MADPPIIYQGSDTVSEVVVPPLPQPKPPEVVTIVNAGGPEIRHTHLAQHVRRLRSLETPRRFQLSTVKPG